MAGILASIIKKNPTGKIDITKVNSLPELLSGIDQIGDPTRILTDNIYGFNTTRGNNAPPATLVYGKVFFTRPMLNFTRLNITNNPGEFGGMLASGDNVYSYIKHTLDPRLFYKHGEQKTALVDPYQAFIPGLSNNLISCTGWPDKAVGTFTTKAGVRRQEHTVIDGCSETYSRWDTDCKIRNVRGMSQLALINSWVDWATKAAEGRTSPYMTFIAQNEICYNTRIYRLILDVTQTRVMYIAATGASTPNVVPMGALADYRSDATVNTDMTELNIRFTSDGAIYNDPRLIDAFNRTAAMFNPEIRKHRLGLSNNLEKVPNALKARFSNRVYPYINYDTLELEYYIDTTTTFFKNVVELLGGA